MTPEEQAAREIDKILVCWCHEAYRGRGLAQPDCPQHQFADDVKDILTAALRTAREEEREAVERAVQSLRGLHIEGFHVLTGTDTDAILAAIRARQ